MHTSHAQRLYEVFEECLDNLCARPQIETEISPQDDLVDLLDRIGEEHRKWLMGLWNRFSIKQEPVLTDQGEIVAEPLLWFRAGNEVYACFGRDRPRQRAMQRLEDAGINILEVGTEVMEPRSEGV